MGKRIYLAGAITGKTPEQASQWRLQFKRILKNNIFGHSFIVINPCEYIPDHITPLVEKECMLWDLDQVRRADIIVCDFSHPDSIGTTWELAVAAEKRIPIIGVYTDGKPEVHPWWRLIASHICENIEDAAEYIEEYYGE